MKVPKEISKRDKELNKIKKEIFALNTSPLYNERIKTNAFPVIGEGSHLARIMFIGEAPGANEASTGRPFVGASGKFLDELLDNISLKREDIYITNIVKDRPPANRDPSLHEIEVYGPFLDRQIAIIQPSVIVTLGRFSMQYIMKKFSLESHIEPISEVHGKVYKTQVLYGIVTIVPLYHPAAALYNGSMRTILKKDFEVLKKFI